MKKSNILGIIKGDFRALTSNVIPIVILIGLILLPCLYAWFNILSNWDPYEPEQTGRIAFAVANEDEGTEMLDMNVNVGEKVIAALEGNDLLGWTIVDTQKDAVHGVRSGDYYAAVVIPKDFSQRALSFTSGELEHPKLIYYENRKRNAIMPKITETARQALMQEIDSAVINALGKFLSSATEAAENKDLDPQDVFGDFADSMDQIAGELDSCLTLITAAQSMSDAADELIDASDNLIGSSRDALRTGEKILDQEDKIIKEKSGSRKSSEALKSLCKAISDDAASLEEELSGVRNDMDAYNAFIEQKLDNRIALVTRMKKSADRIAETLSDLGMKKLAAGFRELSNQIGKVLDKLNSLKKADESNWAEMQKVIDDILAELDTVQNKASGISKNVSSKLDKDIDKAIASARKAISKTKDSLDGAYGKLGGLGDSLSGAEATLGDLDGGLSSTLAVIRSMQQGFYNLAEIFDSFADSDELQDINVLLEDSSDVIGENLAAPIKMKTEVLYPTDHYGSIMAPFYTSLALWAGALFTAIFVSAQVKRRKEGSEDAGETGMTAGGEMTDDSEPLADGETLADRPLTVREMFLGRWRLYLGIGLAQALIVAIGDLLYCWIDCPHPILFTLAVLITGFTFATINFCLRFVFNKIGLVLSVVFILLQVGGSGGTYPIHVLPPIFQKIYPLMPFHYSMDAMRECVAGMYDHTYLKCIGALLLTSAIFIAASLVLYKPVRHMMKKTEDKLEECPLLNH